MSGFGPAICYSRRQSKAIGREVTGFMGSLLWQNRITLLTVAVIALYAAFIQWIWGWGSIFAGWQAVGLPVIAPAFAEEVAGIATARAAGARCIWAASGRTPRATAVPTRAARPRGPSGPPGGA